MSDIKSLNQQLIHAAWDGNESLCIDLLALGANANALVKGTPSPLNQAISRGSLSICKLLIDHGADIGRCDYDHHSSPLHVAARSGHADVCRLLVERGADINAINDGGFTPLHWAAIKGDIDVYLQLLEGGGDPLIKTKKGQTAMDTADAARKPACVRIINSHLAARAARAALQELGRLKNAHHHE